MNKLASKVSSLLNLTIVCLFLALSLGGCQDSGSTSQPKEKGVSQKPAKPAAVQNPVAEQKAPAKEESKKSILNKTTAVVVDAKKALKNPDIEVVDGKIKGVDPFSQAGSAYVSMASRVSTLGMQQAIKAHKALNDSFPSYDEYMKMMKQNRIEFAQLPPYKMYGYDAETGNILVLQDNKKKAQLYKEAGIPLD